MELQRSQTPAAHPAAGLRGMQGAAALRSDNVSRSVPKLDMARYPRSKYRGIT